MKFDFLKKSSPKGVLTFLCEGVVMGVSDPTEGGASSESSLSMSIAKTGDLGRAGATTGCS